MPPIFSSSLFEKLVTCTELHLHDVITHQAECQLLAQDLAYHSVRLSQSLFPLKLCCDLEKKICLICKGWQASSARSAAVQIASRS